jgi:hypothetical protein
MFKAGYEAYTMVGNQVVYEPTLARRHELAEKKKLRVDTCLVDVHGKAFFHDQQEKQHWESQRNRDSIEVLEVL